MTTEYEISVEMKAFFEAIKMTGAERDQPPVLGSVNTDQFQHMFKIANESTHMSTRWPDARRNY